MNPTQSALPGGTAIIMAGHTSQPRAGVPITFPFPRSYWVEPGRLLAGYYPGDKDPRAEGSKLKALIESGVSRVINLMEEQEVDHHGQPFVPYEPRLQAFARQLGRTVDCDRFAIKDRSVPSVAEMVEILDCLDEALARREVVYVHCWGGRGRTGTVIACYLQRTRGLSGSAALSLLAELTQENKRAFWPAPEMPCQREFVRTWKAEA